MKNCCQNFPDKRRSLSETGLSQVLPLGFIVLLAAALRLYRLGEQSVWVDEYFCIGYLNAPDLGTYLSIVRFFSPDTVPLGFIAHYAWGALSGTGSVAVLRLLSVLLGVLCVPLVYLLGRDLYTRKAGLIAALLLALSPVHIYLAQAARPNALVECLALVSLYALARALRGSGLRWWLGNGLANLLLVWTHPFAVLLVAAEGCCLLLSWRSAMPRLASWAVAHCLMMPTPLLWLWPTLGYVPRPEDDFPLSIRPWREVLIDWLGDDCVLSSDPFVFQGNTWSFLSDAFKSFLVAAHPWFDAALMLVFAGCLFGFCLHAFRRIRGGPPPAPASRTSHEAVLLMLVLCLPLGVLVFLSYLWRPCVLPRYTSYSSFALYVIVGVVLANLPRAAWRRGTAAVLAVLYGYQLSFTLPAPTRTDWLAVHHYLDTHASLDDPVLLKGTYVSWDIFRFNAGADARAVTPVNTLQALSEQADSLLGATGPAAPATAVWGIIEPFIYHLPPLERFEACLAARGLRYTRTDFPGMNGVFVYRIERVESPSVDPCRIETSLDCAGILNDMGLGALAPDDYKAAAAALERSIDTEFPRTPFYYSHLAIQLTNTRDFGLATVAAHRAITLAPHYSFAHFALAVALGEKGDIGGAAAAFERAQALDPVGYFRLYGDLFYRLYQQGECEGGRRALTALDTMGVFLPQATRARAAGCGS